MDIDVEVADAGRRVQGDTSRAGPHGGDVSAFPHFGTESAPAPPLSRSAPRLPLVAADVRPTVARSRLKLDCRKPSFSQNRQSDKG
jgi:hypothetical protein